MIDHTGIGVSDMARSAIFYDAALKPPGLSRVAQMPSGSGKDGIGYGHKYPIFWIDRFHSRGVKQHTAFVAMSRSDVDAFYDAALNAGGRTMVREACGVQRRAILFPLLHGFHHFRRCRGERRFQAFR
jgi:catechol 2,3-dioxygenase-like lactoylglutathione lyase family enzyme